MPNPSEETDYLRAMPVPFAVVKTVPDEEGRTVDAVFAYVNEDVYKRQELSCPADGKLDLRELVMLAIATSIDALAVGITFAFLRVDIVMSVGLIGATTFVLALAGVAVGHRFGARYEKAATIAGGIVLVLIGTKILLEHLGILAL